MLAPGAGHALEGKLNLNTATAKDLRELPFIGEKRAAAIVRYREKHGPFDDIDQLLDSKAVGRRTLEAVRPYITLSGTGKGAAPQTAAGFTVRRKINTSPGQVIMLADDEYYPALKSFIDYAAKRIDISMFLFKTTRSRKNRANRLIKDLARAKKRGVAVNVLLENSGYDESINEENRRTARKLRKAGIAVRFESRETTTHTKAVVIDGRFCFVGSHNFTGSALYYNHELSLLVDSRALAADLLEYINRIE